jgi:hypothetical protein
MTHGTRRTHFLPGSTFVAVVVAGIWHLLCAREVRADAVLDWNQIALEATAAAPFDPPRESRRMRLVARCVTARARCRDRMTVCRHRINLQEDAAVD